MAKGGLQFKKVVPKELKVRAMRGEVFNALRLVQVRVEEMFELTVKSWKHQPMFEREKPNYSKDIGSMGVTTNDEIYKLVNAGSPVHAIYPHGDYPLFFHSHYEAKTAPGVIDSWQGGPGEKNVHAFYVDKPGVSHPGFVGRHFDQQILQEIEPLWRYEIQRAMRKAAQASGWAK